MADSVTPSPAPRGELTPEIREALERLQELVRRRGGVKDNSALDLVRSAILALSGPPSGQISEDEGKAVDLLRKIMGAWESDESGVSPDLWAEAEAFLATWPSRETPAVDFDSLPPSGQESRDTVLLDWLEARTKDGNYWKDVVLLYDDEDGYWLAYVERGELRGLTVLDDVENEKPLPSLRAAIEAAISEEIVDEAGEGGFDTEERP